TSILTIYKKKNNCIFKYEDKETFINELTSDQPEPQSYFAQMKKVNQEGLPEFKIRKIDVGTPEVLPGQLFDLRSKEEFKEGFKKGAINIPYNRKFLQFAGWYINYDEPMTVIRSEEQHV